MLSQHNRAVNAARRSFLFFLSLFFRLPRSSALSPFLGARLIGQFIQCHLTASSGDCDAADAGVAHVRHIQSARSIERNLPWEAEFRIGGGTAVTAEACHSVASNSSDQFRARVYAAYPVVVTVGDEQVPVLIEGESAAAAQLGCIRRYVVAVVTRD